MPALRHAFRLHTGRPIAPWGDPVGQVRVLDRPLEAVQEQALRDAGLEPVAEQPRGEPFLVYSDRTWFTAELVRRLVAAGPGRLCVADPQWQAAVEPLQVLPAPGVYEIAVHPATQRPLEPGVFPELPLVVPSLDLAPWDTGAVHPALAHATRPLRVGPAMVHQVDHWSHVLRANLLALAGRGAEAKLRWDRAPWWKKLAQVLGFLVRHRPTDRYRVAAGLTERRRGVKVHPTAVVELSVLEEGVEVGPHAVVRACWVGRGARVEEFATANLAVLGEGARLGRFGMLNLSVVYPGSQVSAANGYQVCVIGRDTFLGWGVTALDLSFGRPIRVEQDGVWVDSGQHFLGVAIGHRARLTYGAYLAAGVSVPNEAFLLGPNAHLLRAWGEAPVGEPCVVVGGRAAPIRRRGTGDV